jgi:hypothetical protein
LHPAKAAKFLDILMRYEKKIENKNFQKKLQNFLPVKKESLLLHPL